jgi:hypothetical protein
MSEQIEALRAIQARQQDDADRDLLTLMTADPISLKVNPSTYTVSYTDPVGGHHCLEIAHPDPPLTTTPE